VTAGLKVPHGSRLGHLGGLLDRFQSESQEVPCRAADGQLTVDRQLMHLPQYGRLQANAQHGGWWLVGH
jgi:hypothetical protein